MCGVCGKMFDLATTLAHHMYSHYTRKHYCDKCDFHCFFKSELEAHKISRRSNACIQSTAGGSKEKESYHYTWRHTGKSGTIVKSATFQPNCKSI